MKPLYFTTYGFSGLDLSGRPIIKTLWTVCYDEISDGKSFRRCLSPIGWTTFLRGCGIKQEEFCQKFQSKEDAERAFENHKDKRVPVEMWELSQYNCKTIGHEWTINVE